MCALLGLLYALPASASVVVPTNGMVIKESTTFASGTYNLPDGVSIAADNVVLDFGGATLVGTNFTGVGVSCKGYSGVTMFNGTLTNYYYGMKFVDSDDLTMTFMNASVNWRDPKAFVWPNPPWLNINVTPKDYGDRTNLGGGLWLENVSRAKITYVWLTYQENGIDGFGVTDSLFHRLQVSNNTGWGIHLYQSSYNNITYTEGVNVTRGRGHYTCDTAGLLLNCGCHHNLVHNCGFMYSGDNVWVTGNGKDGCCPSNYNIIRDNLLPGSPNNAIECTWGQGNVIYQNGLNNSNYGIWAGYSWGNTVISGNMIGGSVTAGIAIDHGLNNVIENNYIGDGDVGVQLFTDEQIHFPLKEYPCLALPDRRHSSGYMIRGNAFVNNAGPGLSLVNTTSSLIYNNLFVAGSGPTATEEGVTDGNKWNIGKTDGPNTVGGPFIAGNYWSNYKGTDTSGDGIGDTDVPYTNGGKLALPGDKMPLVMP